MRTIEKPFEGVLGNTVELRVMERLIASPRMEFNIADLSRMVDVHRDSASKAIQKLLKWNLLIKLEHGPRFRLNEEEPMVVAMKAFNDSIIMQMFPEVANALEEQISEDQEFENIKRGRMLGHDVSNESGK
jgi:hypothetical protein